jgi:threonine dehydrogenase-like Zn-dependent dehydrogenase
MLALTYAIRPARWVLCKAAGWVAPAAFWSPLSGLRLQRIAVPDLPSPRWVRLRPLLGGVCGTDLAAILQRHHPASILQVFSSFPAVLGHENVSVIEEVGAEVRGWKPGDRVVVEPSLSCAAREIEPMCRECTEGRFTACRNFRTGPLPAGSMIGWNNFTGGSWSERFIAHQSQIYRVPDGIDDEVAVLTDPIAGALHAVLRRPPGNEASVAIVGGGMLGLGIAASLRAVGLGCRVVAVVRHSGQSDLLRRYGADDVVVSGRREGQGVRYARVAERVGGRAIASRFGHHALVGGFDVVYDCVGSGQSLTDSMKYARSGGTVIEVGTSQIGLVDTTPLWFDELTVLGANGRAFEVYEGRRLHTYELVFELIRRGRLDLRGLVTHRFRVADYRRALQALMSRQKSGALKVVFTPGA